MDKVWKVQTVTYMHHDGDCDNTPEHWEELAEVIDPNEETKAYFADDADAERFCVFMNELEMHKAREYPL